jgi:GrpB-like predicted nucleotidyltransferase (UPF0157 family)
VVVPDPDLTVEVVPYSSDWPREFADMRDALSRALGAAALSIEHIGSTAVPGLSSKPTIDILVVVDGPERFLARLADVEALGFSYREDNAHVANDDHLFLRRVVDARRTHHLHVLTDGSAEITDYRRFRDALRDDGAFAREYEQLKLRLAADHGSDRARYVAEKEYWVSEQLAALRIDPHSPSTQ